ncbi:hypothetical protein GCM10023320_80900 [Pseudonocardia adelaidensis]|uniref:Uncharacterized protein n=1 Tax=Pseudonocardia adelaidensis TaxID=648754 RepID=A0ABP9P6U1_9PSEU
MDWRGLERAVESTSISDQAEAVDESVRPQFLAANHSLLPPGATLAINERTFAEIDADIATVSATTTGPESAEWELTLLRQDDGSWLIYSTSRR